jgi:hypothetical protein
MFTSFSAIEIPTWDQTVLAVPELMQGNVLKMILDQVMML